MKKRKRCLSGRGEINNEERNNNNRCNMQLTGHPFVDVGLAGIAAIIETEKNIIVNTPEKITYADVEYSIKVLRDKYYFRLMRKDAKGKEKPLFYF